MNYSRAKLQGIKSSSFCRHILFPTQKVGELNHFLTNKLILNEDDDIDLKNYIGKLLIPS